MVAWPQGMGPLADDLWLCMHDDATGRPRLRQRPAGLGLAGAQLAELMLAGAVALDSDRVVVTGRSRAGDVLADGVLDRLEEESGQHSIEVWLAFLAATAVKEVAYRLERAGYLVRQPSRLWRRAGWVPVDMNAAFAPLARLQTRLGAAEDMGVPEVVLAGLASASGLGTYLFGDYGPRPREHLQQLVSGLDPPLRALISTTQTAVDSAVLAQRA